MIKKCIICNNDLIRNQEKFDSKDCANIYYNIKRYNKNWSDQQIIEHLTKKRYCQYCNKELTGKYRNSFYCDQNCRRKKARREKGLKKRGPKQKNVTL
jgi:hypothetical protein